MKHAPNVSCTVPFVPDEDMSPSEAQFYQMIASREINEDLLSQIALEIKTNYASSPLQRILESIEDTYGSQTGTRTVKETFARMGEVLADILMQHMREDRIKNKNNNKK